MTDKELADIRSRYESDCNSGAGFAFADRQNLLAEVDRLRADVRESHRLGFEAGWKAGLEQAAVLIERGTRDHEPGYYDHQDIRDLKESTQ